MSDTEMKYEDWLRGCVHHDGRKGNVYLPCDVVLAIADWLEAHRDGTQGAKSKTERREARGNGGHTMRPIDADALLDAISVHLERIEQEFEDAPTIDPVRHGKWVRIKDVLYECSVCGFSHVYLDDMPNNYCPNCGAKMDGGTDNETD